MFGVPVLYMPYFEHADPSVKRQSGFLMPSFGNSSTLGYGIEIPYYFALAPNYDFTFHPATARKQGVLWQGDWRHRLANGQYTVKLAGIDQDREDTAGAPSRATTAGAAAIETKGQFSLSSLVEVRLGRHGRERRQLPPLLQARSGSCRPTASTPSICRA